MSGYFFDDALVQILKYLPVKTLVQFRSVCKRWKQLIDSPALMQNHLYVQNPTFIVQNGYGPGLEHFVVDPLHLPSHSVKPLEKPIQGGEFHLLGTLHGVVCLYGLREFFLWNPSIRKVSSIHLSLKLSWYFQAVGWQACYGFWIHPATKAFKIIVLQTGRVRNCFLYSSIHGHGNWSEIPTPGKLKDWRGCCGERPPVMIGAVAHWGGFFDKSVGLHHNQLDNVILSFDFIQECFEFIELPNSYEHYKNTTPFCWKDMLSLLCWSNQFPSECKIFLRREDSWIAMFDFKVSSSLVDVFWAMEDLEASDGGVLVAEDNVRVLATILSDPESSADELLVLDGTRSGCRPVREGLERYIYVNMAFDFVESLLFPKVSSAKNFNLD